MPRVLSEFTMRTQAEQREGTSTQATIQWAGTRRSCTGAKWLHPASSRDFPWGRRERREPDTPCKGHRCQGFPSQTLQLQWAIFQLWPPWSSGPSAEWRRKSSPVIQFPQCATKSKVRVATRLVLGTTDHHSHGLPQRWVTLKKRNWGYSLVTEHLPSMWVPGF